MTIHRLYSCLSILSLFALSGCASENRAQNLPSTPESFSRMASSKIDDSFKLNSADVSRKKTDEYVDHLSIIQTDNQSFLDVSGTQITLRKSAIGKAFLLTPSLLVRDNTPEVHLMQPKVVSFERNGDQLALFELNHNVIYDELPSSKLLQTMPVIQESEDGIEFSWKYGLAAAPLTFGLGASDFPSTLIEMLLPYDRTLPVQLSFIKNLTLSDEGLDVEQISRIQASDLSLNLLSFFGGPSSITAKDFTVQINFNLRPYRPNPEFSPLLSRLKDGIGFFEIPRLRKQDGGVELLAMRWDLSPRLAPVTFVISKSVPKELVQPMSEGILYWNRVAGRKVVEVELNGDPRSVLRSRRVPIVWTPWRQATVARAAAQSDPITGEIINGSIFITSSFNNFGQICAAQNKPLDVSFEVKGAQQMGIGPDQFILSPTCSWSTIPHQSAFLELKGLSHDQSSISHSESEQSEKSLELPERKDEIIFDYVRLTIAHEVGHTLGLRHNFAGSMGSKLPSTVDHFKEWQGYLKDRSHLGAEVSSTVMDYLNGRDTFLLGAWIREHELPYDQLAFQWAYADKPISTSSREEIPFCTDAEAFSMKTLGCMPFDSGKDPLFGFAQDIAINRFGMTSTLFNLIISKIYPDFKSDQMTVKAAISSLDLSRFSSEIAKHYRWVFQLASTEGKTLQVDRALGGKSWLNEDEYNLKTAVELAQGMAEVGGLPRYFQMAFKTSEDFILEKGWILKDLEEALHQSDFAQGTTFSGTKYHLTQDEISSIESYLPKIAERLESYYLRDLLIEMTGGSSGMPPAQGLIAVLIEMLQGKPSSYGMGIVQDSWQGPLGQIASQILKDSEGEISGTVNEQTKSVPKPRYELDVRLAAVRLFSKDIFMKTDWLSQVRSEMIETITHRLLLVGHGVAQNSSGKVALLYEGIQATFQKPSFLFPSLEGKNVSPELRAWFLTELVVLKALKETENGLGESKSGSPSFLNESLAKSMLGFRF